LNILEAWQFLQMFSWWNVHPSEWGWHMLLCFLSRNFEAEKQKYLDCFLTWGCSNIRSLHKR